MLQCAKCKSKKHQVCHWRHFACVYFLYFLHDKIFRCVFHQLMCVLSLSRVEDAQDPRKWCANEGEIAFKYTSKIEMYVTWIAHDNKISIKMHSNTPIWELLSFNKKKKIHTKPRGKIEIASVFRKWTTTPKCYCYFDMFYWIATIRTTENYVFNV